MHPFTYLLKVYYVSTNCLDAGDKSVNKTEWSGQVSLRGDMWTKM